jgi:hypothetical protein
MMNIIAKILEAFGVGPKTANAINVAVVTCIVVLSGVNVWAQGVQVFGKIDTIIAQNERQYNNDSIALMAVIDLSIAIEKNTESLKAIAKNPNNKAVVELAEKAIAETNKTYLPHYTIVRDSSHLYRRGNIKIKPIEK